MSANEHSGGKTPAFSPSIRDVPAPIRWNKRIGSWGQFVKDGNDFWDDHIPDTLTALKETWQNLVIYPISTEEEWGQFQDLLEECAADTDHDVHVYAAMTSPSLYLDDAARRRLAQLGSIGTGSSGAGACRRDTGGFESLSSRAR